MTAPEDMEAARPPGLSAWNRVLNKIGSTPRQPDGSLLGANTAHSDLGAQFARRAKSAFASEDDAARNASTFINRLQSISLQKVNSVGGTQRAQSMGGDSSAGQLRLRNKSMLMLHGDPNRSPALSTKAGSFATYVYAPNPVPGRGICFSPCGQNLMRYGWGPDLKLLQSKDCEMISSLCHTTGHIRFATFSSDGKYIAAATDDCRLLVWDVGQVLTARLRDPFADIDVGAEPLAYCQISPDGSCVLSCDDDGQLELWSISEENMVRRFEVNHASKRASFNGDGTVVISCSDYDIQVTLLDTDSGTVISFESFEGLEESRNKASYVISGDGSYVLVYVTEQCYVANCAIYNTQTQTYHKVLACNGALAHAEFTHDGKVFVVAGRDDRIHVYDSSTGSLVVTLHGHSSDVLFCRVSVDRRFAISGDNSGQVLLWDVDTGTCNVRLQAHNCPVAMCDLNASCSHALTLDTEGHAYVWNLAVQGLCDVLRQQSDMLCCVQYIAGTQDMVVGYSDGSVKAWTVGQRGDILQLWSHSHHETSCLECIATVEAPTHEAPKHHEPGRSGSAACAAYVASGSSNGAIVLVDSRDGRCITKLHGHSDTITCLMFSSDGALLASGSRDGSARVWCTATGRSLHVIEVPNESDVTSCAISVVGSVVALGCACGTTYLYSLADSEQIHALAVTHVAVESVAFSAQGKYLSIGCADGCTAIVETETGEVTRHLVGNAEGVQATWFPSSKGSASGNGLAGLKVVSLCSRQAVTWDAGTGAKSCITDFVADELKLFNNRTMQGRHFVSHNCLSLFDPTLNAAMYDVRSYDKHPGESFLFRRGTSLMRSGTNHLPLILFVPPATTLHMLLNESGNARALDFSSDGYLLVNGNLRGELLVWDVDHRCMLHKWSAHKRSAITCVKFSHDSASIYSCGEDCKVILWDWKTQVQTAQLVGHKAPVISVDMSLDGLVMASGDKDGNVIIWSTDTRQAHQVLTLHDGPVLCCSLSPDGSMVASSGQDEHIVVADTLSGEDFIVLDSALDGKGLTIKFSFDGTKVLFGGEKGSVLIWDVFRNCLLYDIAGHNGKVYDCAWSGDSRRVLSVGSDGCARLWDAAAGSELCMADLGRGQGFGAVDAGGFLKCDLSADGSNMAGCTARGQLVLWSVAAELRRGPEGSMLYQWLASMPLSQARDILTTLLEHFPLVVNTQDSRGWTVLMHSAHDSNPEILKLIVGSVRSRSGMLGLAASPAARGLSSAELREARLSDAQLVTIHGSSKSGTAKELDALYSQRSSRPSLGNVNRSGLSVVRATKEKSFLKTGVRNHGTASRQHSAARIESPTGKLSMEKAGASRNGSVTRGSSTHLHHNSKSMSFWSKLFGGNAKVAPLPDELHFGPDFHDDDAPTDPNEHVHKEPAIEKDDCLLEPNAIKIALASNSADCVTHLLEAVLTEKITPGSYHAITSAIPDVAERYPALCQTFMTGLPLIVLGEVEIPSSLAAQGRIVRAAKSYTSYKEMWHDELKLDRIESGTPMVLMEAAMVRLPFSASVGGNTILRTLVEANVPVETFGSSSVQAIIDYKWQRFARNQIYARSLIYLIYVVLFTTYAVVFSDDVPAATLHDLLATHRGRLEVALSCVLFLFGTYYMGMEMHQLSNIGFSAYFNSFWNLIDLVSYAATMVIMPCVVTRTMVDQGQLIPALIACEVILLWIKQMFFALAVDGLGTFIYMTFEIIKGMRFFMLLLIVLFISFGTSFMVLFRGPGLPQLMADLPTAAADGAGGGSSGDNAAVAPGAQTLFDHYTDLGTALLSAFLVMFGNDDPRNAMDTDWPQLATILLCVYNFALIVVLLNMLITLMSEVYVKVVRKQQVVFLQGRAELIIEVETTGKLKEDTLQIPPYLHLLRPSPKQPTSDDSGTPSMAADKKSGAIAPAGGGGGGGDEDNGGGDDGGDDGGGDGGGGAENRRATLTCPSKREMMLAAPSRRFNTMRRGSMTSEAAESCAWGQGGDADLLMKELVSMKRMMELMSRQVKLLEANQQFMIQSMRGNTGNQVPMTSASSAQLSLAAPSERPTHSTSTKDAFGGFGVSIAAAAGAAGRLSPAHAHFKTDPAAVRVDTAWPAASRGSSPDNSPCQTPNSNPLPGAPHDARSVSPTGIRSVGILDKARDRDAGSAKEQLSVARSAASCTMPTKGVLKGKAASPHHTAEMAAVHGGNAGRLPSIVPAHARGSGHSRSQARFDEDQDAAGLTVTRRMQSESAIRPPASLRRDGDDS